MYNNPLLTKIKTVIEAVSGELVIDDSSNKSGLRKQEYPEYPIFKSFNDSYVFYDNKNIFYILYRPKAYCSTFKIFYYTID